VAVGAQKVEVKPAPEPVEEGRARDPEVERDLKGLELGHGDRAEVDLVRGRVARD
jgi:hypothetical protein